MTPPDMIEIRGLSLGGIGWAARVPAHSPEATRMARAAQRADARRADMRRHSALLDSEDPMKVLGRLPEPLLTPAGNEREGYVPNVVYSCGGQIFDGELIIPYAMSDHASGFATVRLDDLIDTLLQNPA